MKGHPGVESVEMGAAAALEFGRDAWHRELWVARPDLNPGGLVEIIDNNPLVCADRASVPSPTSTLALIGLCPLLRAGIIVESPTILLNVAPTAEDLEGFLLAMGWEEGATQFLDAHDLGGVAAASVMAMVRNPESFDDLDALFEEAYGRSLYVRRDEDSEWDPALVRGKPYALYRLRLSEGEENSLLTIQILADLDGKCGAAQVVHAFNVMCGFEESLGID